MEHCLSPLILDKHLTRSLLLITHTHYNKQILTINYQLLVQFYLIVIYVSFDLIQLTILHVIYNIFNKHYSNRSNQVFKRANEIG